MLVSIQLSRFWEEALRQSPDTPHRKDGRFQQLSQQDQARIATASIRPVVLVVFFWVLACSDSCPCSSRAHAIVHVPKQINILGTFDLFSNFLPRRTSDIHALPSEHFLYRPLACNIVIPAKVSQLSIKLFLDLRFLLVHLRGNICSTCISMSLPECSS